MANILLKIDINNNGGKALTGFVSDKSVNNISPDLGTTTTDNKGIEGLSFAQGYLIFEDGYLRNADSKRGFAHKEKSYNGFMFGATDNNGNYEVTLTIEGVGLEKIIITGDQTANQFPTVAIVDNERTIYSDDYTWAINLGNKSNSHTIKFVKWNRPNYNACFTTLKVNLVLNKAWIDSLESTSQTTPDATSINYGVLANSGSATIRDLNGEIKEGILEGAIANSNLPIEIYANGNLIQKNIITNSSYDNINKIFNIELTNKIANFDFINFPITKSYDKNEQGTNPMGFLTRMILEECGFKENEIEDMLNTPIYYGKYTDDYKNSSYGTIKDYLWNITIPAIYYGGYTAREVLDSICNIAQLSMIQKNNGDIKFLSSRPIMNGNEKVIVVPQTFQQSSLKYDIIVRNKYDKIKFIKNVASEVKEYVLDNNYTLEYDGQGNIDISSIPLDYTQIIDVGGNKYLCFFLTATSNGWLAQYNLRNLRTSIKSITYQFSTSNSAGMSGRLESTTEYLYTKEDFNFTTELAYLFARRMSQYKTRTSETFAVKIPLPEMNVAGQVNLNIKIGALVYRKSDQEVIAGNGNNLLEYTPDTKIMSDLIKYDDITMYDLIANNILNDYKDGIRTAQISIFCGDFYDTQGDVAKNWQSGEIIEVGEIIRIDDAKGSSILSYNDGKSVYWRVTGAKFRYDGQPLMDLELQEVKY